MGASSSLAFEVSNTITYLYAPLSVLNAKSVSLCLGKVSDSNINHNIDKSL